MKRIFSIVSTMVLGAFALQCQTVLFPTLTGNELQQALVQTYKPKVVYNYNDARDIMYRTIDNVNDSVSCIYTGHTLYLPFNVDPSNYLYNNASSNGINCEHSYPQSKGAGEENGNAHSDMHHLFPSRTSVNSARGNLPYGEIADNLTSKWFFENISSEQIPGEQIDAYSEVGSGYFEPRESVKGNIARAIFYFYTMYRDEALEADPAFFELQRETLCDWHVQDPTDMREEQRSADISAFQDDKENPFVLDCSAAIRLYCPNHALTCDSSGVVFANTNKSIVFPNPSNGATNVQFEVHSATELDIEIVDMLGRRVEGTGFQLYAEGTHFLPVSISLSGVYVALIKNRNKIVEQLKFVVQ